MTARDRLNRIVALVAELSRQTDPDGVPIGELAARFGVTVREIQRDLRALTLLGDQPEADWLASLAVWQEEDRLHVSSMGPYRRPVRLLPDELLALRVAVATDPAGDGLARRLAGGFDDPAPPVALAGTAREGRVGPALHRAVRNARCVDIRYADGNRDVSERRIEPHRLVEWSGRLYCVAWCRRAAGWRQFRADRMLEVVPADEGFTRRADADRQEDGNDPVFRFPGDGVDEVRVRFAPSIARWIAERYPRHERHADGSVVVTFDVANEEWLVRHVLQYGAEAEVLAPADYRAAVREALR